MSDIREKLKRVSAAQSADSNTPIDTYRSILELKKAVRQHDQQQSRANPFIANIEMQVVDAIQYPTATHVYLTSLDANEDDIQHLNDLKWQHHMDFFTFVLNLTIWPNQETKLNLDLSLFSKGKCISITGISRMSFWDKNPESLSGSLTAISKISTMP